MKNFKAFELIDMNSLTGGGKVAAAAVAAATVTNVATSYTQETRGDKDSNAAGENKKEVSAGLLD
jgi:ribosomal protein L12E/L44/L45/RPP1/RPP2